MMSGFDNCSKRGEFEIKFTECEVFTVKVLNRLNLYNVSLLRVFLEFDLNLP